MSFKLSWLLRSSSTVASLSKELEAANFTVAQLQAENAGLHALVVSLREKSSAASLSGKLEAAQAQGHVLEATTVDSGPTSPHFASLHSKREATQADSFLQGPVVETTSIVSVPSKFKTKATRIPQPGTWPAPPPPLRMTSSDSLREVVEGPIPQSGAWPAPPPPLKMTSSDSPLEVVEEPCPSSQNLAGVATAEGSGLGDSQSGRRRRRRRRHARHRSGRVPVGTAEGSALDDSQSGRRSRRRRHRVRHRNGQVPIFFGSDPEPVYALPMPAGRTSARHARLYPRSKSPCPC